MNFFNKKKAKIKLSANECALGPSPRALKAYVKKYRELQLIIKTRPLDYELTEKSLLELLHNSGYPGVKFEKKVDFENLYKQQFN